MLEQRSWSVEGARLESVPCNLCGRGDAETLAHENGLPIVRCAGCGLIYVSPRPIDAELDALYEDYYTPEAERDWARAMGGLIERDLARIRAHAPAGGHVLDVGAGFGHLLLRLRECGYRVAALEGSPVAAERLRAREVPLHFGRSPEVPLPAKEFDAAVASSVLEHVADPLGVLRQMHATLRPGGLAIVRVPNLELFGLFFHLKPFERSASARALMGALRRELMEEGNLFHVIDPPAHLYGFTKETLRAALARAGFRDVEIAADPMPRRGTRVNALIDGSVATGASVLRALSGGRIHLAPYVTALARS